MGREQQQQQQQQQESLTIEQAFNIAYNLSCIAFWMVAPFLREALGKCAAGMPALLAFLLTMGIAATYRSLPLTVYSWAWIGAFTFRRMTPGKEVSTKYNGNPDFTGLFISDRWLAMLAEVPLVFAIGAVWMRHDVLMGRFFTWVSLGLGVKYWIESQYHERMQDAIGDASLLTQYHMNKLKER
jgi:hypothetical protein